MHGLQNLKIFFRITFPLWLLVLPVANHPYIHGLSNISSDKRAVKRKFNDVTGVSVPLLLALYISTLPTKSDSVTSQKYVIVITPAEIVCSNPTGGMDIYLL